jgi:hypothetical protein
MYDRFEKPKSIEVAYRGHINLPASMKRVIFPEPEFFHAEGIGMHALASIFGLKDQYPIESENFWFRILPYETGWTVMVYFYCDDEKKVLPYKTQHVTIAGSIFRFDFNRTTATSFYTLKGACYLDYLSDWDADLPLRSLGCTRAMDYITTINFLNSAAKGVYVGEGKDFATYEDFERDISIRFEKQIKDGVYWFKDITNIETEHYTAGELRKMIHMHKLRQKEKVIENESAWQMDYFLATQLQAAYHRYLKSKKT